MDSEQDYENHKGSKHSHLQAGFNVDPICMRSMIPKTDRIHREQICYGYLEMWDTIIETFLKSDRLLCIRWRKNDLETMRRSVRCKSVTIGMEI